MTVDDLYELMKKLRAEGKASHTVVMSIDPEGNGFHEMDDDYSTGGWDGEGFTSNPRKTENAVWLWPK